MKKQYLLVNGRVRSIKPGNVPSEVIAKLEEKGHKVIKCKAPPSIATLEKWVSEGIAKATDGCRCDPDGECEHGHKSWLLQLNMI